jgi:ATP-binding cassette, subfamily A (ABC1), member 3
VPDNAVTQDLRTQLILKAPGLSSRVQMFASEGVLEDYIGDSEYAKSPSRRGIVAAIIINKVGLNAAGQYDWDYTLRMNGTGRGDRRQPFQAVPNTFQKEEKDDLELDYLPDDWKLYWRNGYMLLQDFVENYMITKTLGVAPPQIEASFRPFPEIDHISDEFADIVGSFLGLLYTLVFLWPVTRIIKSILEEKESRMKEQMKMMGLPESLLWLSWLVTYIVIFFITSLLIMMFASSSMFEFSNDGLILLFFFLFGLTVFAFCYMVSAFFDRARVGATIGALVFLAIFFPYFTVSDQRVPIGTKTLACLSAPIAFGLGSTAIAELEAQSVGLTYDSIDFEIKNFTVATAIGMLVFDFFLYLVLGLYVTRVVPSKYGVQLPWNFCLTRSYWCGSGNNAEPAAAQRRANTRLVKEESANADYDHKESGIDHALARSKTHFEGVPAELGARSGVFLDNISKTYYPEQGPEVKAVQNLSLSMFEGQIFALLGHNGAGKSTTINMLSGLFEPSSGTASMFGLDLATDLDDIRHSLGVCPQHNILFDELTVKEHLELFALLKRIAPEKVSAEVEAIISEVGLVEKTDVYSHALSGGQKRKLHLAMALIGDSRIVFLDEPTSGMDVYSRRSTWEMLKRRREGRVIILTTHFMDEADQLGDRIAIMANGNAVCCGSSLFLKNLYGVGYTLTVTTSPGHSADTVINTVSSIVHNAEVLSEAAREVSFRLPFASSASFSELFEAFENGMGDDSPIGVANYGVSVTTLEEVFLRVGREEGDLDIDEADQSTKLKQDLIHRRESATVTPAETIAVADAGAGAAASASLDIVEQPDISKARHSFQDMTNMSKTKYNIDPERPTMWNHVQAMLVKRFHNAKRDRKLLLWSIVYPFLIVLLGLGLLKFGTNIKMPATSLNSAVYDTPNVVPFHSRASATSSPMSFLDNTLWANNNQAVNVSQATTPEALAQYLLDTYRVPAYATSRYGAFFVSNATVSVHAITLFFNTTATHSLPAFYNMYNNLLYQQMTGGADSSARISARMHPLPFTTDQRSLQSSLTAVIIGIGFAFIPAAFVSYVVFEREIGFKHQQFISGVNPLAYWLSNAIFDFLNYLIPAFLTFMIVFIYDINQLSGEATGVTLLSIILHGTSVIPFTYMLSYAFDNHTSAQNLMLIVYIFAGALLLIGSVVLDIIDTTQDINKVFKFVYRVLPSFAFGEVMVNTIIRDAAVAFGEPRSPWDIEVSGYPMLYMAIETVVYSACVMVIEYILRTPDLLRRCKRQPADPEVVGAELVEELEDPDIAAEEQRMRNSSAEDGKDVIRVEGLRKLYNHPSGVPKVAVRNMWLGIPEGECFGFLGINGAGKTSTLKMLTGDVIPSSGTAYLKGMNILTQQQDIRHHVGYCPQFDALIPTLTAREHLVLYARIKGVDATQIHDYVDSIIAQLSLDEYADKAAGGYSGGNKRKLNVGIALIGSPSIVFLDEPSTGMDPKSRRFMWDLISSTMQGRSAVLTTHSMEECEALCGRISIMVGGRLRCLGSSQHLKSTYGDGFQVDISTGEQTVERVIRFLHAEFKDCVPLEAHGNSVKYRIARGDWKLSSLFSLMEARRSELGIAQYAISETSLEQIFIAFARQQDEEQGEVAGLRENMTEEEVLERAGLTGSQQNSELDYDGRIQEHAVSVGVTTTDIPTVTVAAASESESEAAAIEMHALQQQ